MKTCPFCAEEIQEAARVCKHCSRDLAAGASQVQLVQPKKRTGPVAMGCAVILGLLGMGWCVTLFRDDPPAPTAAPAGQTAPGAKPTATPSPWGKWRVQETASSVDDSKTVVLQLEADSDVRGWPATRTTPALVIRCQQSKTEAFINTGLVPHVEGLGETASVLLRFDKTPAKTYRATKSTDSKGLFLPSAISLTRTMSKHDRMLFRFTPFNSDPQETTFDLRGLSSALPPLQKACGWS